MGSTREDERRDSRAGPSRRESARLEWSARDQPSGHDGRESDWEDRERERERDRHERKEIDRTERNNSRENGRETGRESVKGSATGIVMVEGTVEADCQLDFEQGLFFLFQS